MNHSQPYFTIGKQKLFKLSKNDTSRVKGDLQAQFCERLAGETPACLLGGKDNYHIGHEVLPQSAQRIRSTVHQLFWFRTDVVQVIKKIKNICCLILLMKQVIGV